MMRPHCDRCDALCDEYPSWIEDNESPLDEHRRPVVGFGTNPIWHIHIDSGGSSHFDNSKMFCRRCRIAILEAHVAALRLAKEPIGGHLMDCQWDPVNRRYACAEGCEIKRMNESTQLKVKCDGNHAMPRCADPECWQDNDFEPPTVNNEVV